MRCTSLAFVLALASPAPAQPRPVHDAASRLEAFERHRTMRASAVLDDQRWRWIGPQVMSGRVTGIAVPPGRPWHVWVASASGGVWRTRNEGTTWEPMLEDVASPSTGAIAVAPSEPDHVWVGTGESNIFRSSMAGTGVYRSVDGGETWRHRGLADTHTIARIVIHPDDPDTAWVAASGHEWTDHEARGVYRTTDGGASWRKVLFVDERTGAIDLAMDPEDPDRLYAATWERIRRKWSDPKPGPGSGIWKSEDGGASWREVREGLPPKATTGRIGLAVARSRPGRVYALVDSHEIARQPEEGELDSYGRPREEVIVGATLYRSDDFGESWSQVNEPSETMERLYATYGWVFGQVRVDPADADVVWVLGVPLLRSEDGGRTFERVRYRGLHGDHHALWIDPADPNHLVSGNDGGINLSYDGGASWKNLENLPVVQFYNVAVDDAEPFRVYGSIQDNGSWRGPVTHRPGRDADSDWERIPGGEASHFAIAPGDPPVLYSGGFYGRLMRSTLDPRRTVDVTPRAGDGEAPLRGQWLAPFVLSPHNSGILYHGLQCVFRSVDRGESWQRISPDLSWNRDDRRGDIPFQTVTALDESPLRFGLLYAGTDDGRLHVTVDGGATWRDCSGGLVHGKWVSRVVASRFDEDRVWATQNGKRDDDFAAYVWQSEDRGRTWQDRAEGVPSAPANVIREDPRDPDVLYLGTDLGVYVSLDGGRRWDVLGAGLPIAFVHDLALHPREHVLVAATHGRGMWTLDVAGLVRREPRAF